MGNLSKAVHTQQEDLDTIEQNIEVAKLETGLGLLELIKARRAKFAGIPIAGALVGKFLTFRSNIHTRSDIHLNS